MRNPDKPESHRNKVCPSGWACLLLFWGMAIGTGIVMLGMIL